MEDILKRVVALLRADTVLATLTGATTADSRVYLFYRADADIAPTIPGYITVSLSGETPSGAVVTPTYTIAVWARSQDKLEPMGARVRAVLHKQVHVTSAGRRFYSKQVTATDRFQPQSNFSSKTLQYTAGWLEIAGALTVGVAEAVGTDD